MSDNMQANPYRAPASTAAEKSAQAADATISRPAAVRSFRLAVLLLLPPALFNLVLFNAQIVPPATVAMPGLLFRIVNVAGFAATFAVLLIYGVTILDQVVRVLHYWLARRSELHEWQNALYRVLRRAPFFAVAGAVVWTIWVAAIYRLGADFFVVSVPTAVVSHLLAAGLYMPLIWQWYRLEHRASRT